PPIESINDLTLTDERACERTNKRANIRPLLTPKAVARGAYGHSPLDYDPRFSLSPFNGVVTLKEGLAGA
ncbi:uncharacterized protein K441DRAFT_660194, partial [Cenococcum geophilum 1.58]|uniref:uncharacterized protein n=1 Tax=Cenococcum geophilum 1.58 TaxID=794803 RepID=UPI00358EDF7C